MISEVPTSFDREAFAQRLLHQRSRLGLTQAQLGERIGVSRAAVASYETQASEPTLAGLLRLAAVFKVTADYLLGLASGTPPPAAEVDDESIETSEADALEQPHPLAAQVASARAEVGS